MTLEDNSYDPATWGKYPSGTDEEGDTYFDVPDSNGNVRRVYPGLSDSDDPVEAADEQADFERRSAEGPLFTCGTRWVSPIEQLGSQIEQMLPPDKRTPEIGYAIGKEFGFWMGLGTVQLVFKLLERLFGGSR